jgi:DNA-binding MarR family transcriptional regulator
VKQDAETSRIMLGLLDAVEQDNAHSQRHLASELGIALGLVNAYLKRCMQKGLIKARQAPARRYAYYLTPRGFAEKSRLTVEYLSYSLSFFRQAKSDCSTLFGRAKARGIRTVILVGRSDLAEIAALCAIEHGIEIGGLVDGDIGSRFMNAPVFAAMDQIDIPFEAVLITDVGNARSSVDAAIACFGADKVLVPDVLRVRIPVGERSKA